LLADTKISEAKELEEKAHQKNVSEKEAKILHEKAQRLLEEGYAIKLQSR
jgi:hypothetical protein